MDILNFILIEILMITLHALYIADNVRNKIPYIHLIILIIIWGCLLIADIVRLLTSLNFIYLC